jgi:periplasmic protein TonB
MEKTNIFAADWCEIVFENRNRAYGAYLLRQLSSNRHMKAILLMFAFILPAIFYTHLHSVKGHSGRIPTDEIMKPGIINVEPIKPPVIPKDLSKPLPPKVAPSIRFVLPRFVDDRLVQEEKLVSIDVILDSKKAISDIDVKGNVDVGGTVLHSAEIPAQQAAIAEENAAVRTYVDEMPVYPGGETALMKYIKDNLVYPQTALEAGAQGTVYLTFVVGLRGEITDIKVMRGIGFGCNEEALRVIRNMPPWIVGRQNGHPVRVQFNLPVTFKIAN